MRRRPGPSTAATEHPKDDRAAYDVIVAGGGNAALCAAISAARVGVSVIVLEAAPKFYRGGNTRHTRNMRCAHDAATATLTGPYTEDEFWDDLLAVTEGQTDEQLARHMIAQSKPMLEWIQQQGVRFQPSLGGTLSLGRTNSFFLGGGRAMLNALYQTAEQLGVEVRYNSEVVDLEIDGTTFKHAIVKTGEKRCKIKGRAFVAAAGGFEANIEWLKAVVYDGLKAVATGRLDFQQQGRIGRVAVLESYRRRGLGTLVMQALEEVARSGKADQLWFHAQISAVPFYLSLGYSVVGDEFMEADIPHVSMEKQLA